MERKSLTITKLSNKLKKYMFKKDIDFVKKAYKFANKYHEGMKRVSGEPYIQHPLNTAYILAELKLDAQTIAAAFLHDVIEDTSATLELIKKEFGEVTAMLVDGVTKLTELRTENREERNYENIRKMFLASVKDVRIILIKLADKLHNMRTLSYLSEDKQKRIAQDCLEIYAPLAFRLGLANIKWELEDTSFKYINPEMFYKLKEKFRKRKEREEEVNVLKKQLNYQLKKEGIKTKIIGRPKHFYSIYKKMQEKKRTLEEIYDLIGLRVITKDVKDCYEALGIIHNLWKPIHGEFDDYIAVPKPNMYQSLHTAVIDDDGRIIEIQIRTEEMNKISEEGIAAHWAYKGLQGDKNFDKKISWIKEIMDWQKDSTSAKEFIEDLKLDFFGNEIYVFTPKGRVVTLAKGSTSIDFAYAIHSSIGERCIGAVVNGRIVPLRYKLETGDIVNILTSRTPAPKMDWLKIVKTSKAKNKIKNFLKKEKNIRINAPTEKILKSEIDENKIFIIKNVKKPKISIAKCCSPLPGDPIHAYVTRTNRVIVHKKDCKNLRKYTSRKPVEIKWQEDFSGKITLKIFSKDRVGIFADVLNTIASAGYHVRNASGKMVGNNDSEITVILNPQSLDHLKEIIRRIKNIQDIKKIRMEL